MRTQTGAGPDFARARGRGAAVTARREVPRGIRPGSSRPNVLLTCRRRVMEQAVRDGQRPAGRWSGQEA
jgi:hypothetical protein